MIETSSQAKRAKIEAEAGANRIRELEAAKVEAEGERMKIYSELPSSVLVGLAARELAGKLNTIEHLNITPELLGPRSEQLDRSRVGARMAHPGRSRKCSRTRCAG